MTPISWCCNFAIFVIDKSMWDYRDKLQNELNLSKELNQLLASKADFMEGHKLDLVSSLSLLYLCVLKKH